MYEYTPVRRDCRRFFSLYISSLFERVFSFSLSLFLCLFLPSRSCLAFSSSPSSFDIHYCMNVFVETTNRDVQRLFLSLSLFLLANFQEFDWNLIGWSLHVFLKFTLWVRSIDQMNKLLVFFHIKIRWEYPLIKTNTMSSCFRPYPDVRFRISSKRRINSSLLARWLHYSKFDQFVFFSRTPVEYITSISNLSGKRWRWSNRFRSRNVKLIFVKFQYSSHQFLIEWAIDKEITYC